MRSRSGGRCGRRTATPGWRPIRTRSRPEATWSRRRPRRRSTCGAARATSWWRSSPGPPTALALAPWGELLLAYDGSTDLSRFDLAGVPRGRIVTGITGRIAALTTGRPLTADGSLHDLGARRSRRDVAALARRPGQPGTLPAGDAGRPGRRGRSDEPDRRHRPRSSACPNQSRTVTWSPPASPGKASPRSPSPRDRPPCRKKASCLPGAGNNLLDRVTTHVHFRPALAGSRLIRLAVIWTSVVVLETEEDAVISAAQPNSKRRPCWRIAPLHLQAHSSLRKCYQAGAPGIDPPIRGLTGDAPYHPQIRRLLVDKAGPPMPLFVSGTFTESIFSLKNEPEGGSEAIRRKGLLSWLVWN